jgi:hypothetical protein
MLVQSRPFQPSPMFVGMAKIIILERGAPERYNFG